MCRSTAQGGRRCNGKSCAASRRERQRRYQARVRAARKASASGGGLFSRLSGPVSAIELDADMEKLLSRGGDDHRAAMRMHLTLDEMVKQGRFAILDDPVSDADRVMIAAMSEQEVCSRLDELRAHLNTDMLVSRVHEHHRRDIAEKAARLIGDVTNTWVDAQIAEELASANEYLDTLGSFLVNEDAVSRRAQEIINEGTATGDLEFRAEGFEIQQESSQRKSEMASAADSFAKYVSAARLTVFAKLLDASVGSSEATPVGEIYGKKKATEDSLEAINSLFPDEWKRRTAELRPLVIRASTARAHYSGNSPVMKQAFRAYITDQAYSMDAEVPTPVDIVSRRGYRSLTVLMGGDPDNPEHVKDMEAEKKRIEAEDAEWMKLNAIYSKEKSKPRWEVYTNDYGKLALRETFPRGKHVAGYESVIRVGDSRSTLAHELAHRMEHGNPHLRDVCHEFIRRRTTDAAGNRDEPTKYRKDKEPVFEDNLIHAYMGKMYDSRHTEVLSTGMEMLFFGRFGAGLGIAMTGTDQYERRDPEHSGKLVADRDHANVVMGLLMSASKLK